MDQDIHITIPRGRYRDLDATMEIDSQISAPVSRGQPLGLVSIRLDDELLLNEPIVSTQDIAEGGLVTRALDSVKLLFQ